MSMDYEKLIGILNEQRSVMFINKENYDYIASIVLTDGRTVEMKISFPDAFPIVPPIFKVIGLNGFQVHIDPSGKACLFDKSSILFDMERPAQILLDCYDQAMDIINTSPNSKSFLQEMVREFNAYWSYYAKACINWICELPSQKYYKTSILWINNLYILASSIEDARFIACNYMKCTEDGTEKTIPCTIVSLRNGSTPMRIQKEYRWNEVRRYILENTSSAPRRAFKSFLTTKILGKKDYIFIVICPTEYGDLIFGFVISCDGIRNEAIEHCQNVKLSPIYIKRMNRDHLLVRGGAVTDLSNKKALLLGCGSVGGFIAANLCQMGIGSIDLLDNDHFSIENVHRHFLGFDAAFSSNTEKADLLKARLEQMHPFTDIDALNYKNRSAELFIQDIDRLRCYDIIISALGEPTINLEINRLILKNDLQSPFIVCFNEPYGIGGHVIASNLDKDSCLRCLYTNVDGSDLCSYRASLVSPHQNFKKIYQDVAVRLFHIHHWTLSKQH